MVSVGRKFNISRERVRQIKSTIEEDLDYEHIPSIYEMIENLDKEILELQQRKTVLEGVLELLNYEKILD